MAHYHHCQVLSVLLPLVIVLSQFVQCRTFTPKPLQHVMRPPINALNKIHRSTVAVSASASASASASESCKPQSRRNAIESVARECGRLVVCTSVLVVPQDSIAAVTDETGSPANTYSDSAYSRERLGLDASSSSANNSNPETNKREQQTQTPTDEIIVTIPISKIQNNSNGGGGLGIQLADIEFRTNRRVYIRSVSPNSIGQSFGIQKDFVLVSINGQTAERTDAKGAAQMVATVLRTAQPDADPSAPQPQLQLVLRDPAVFRDQIQNLPATGDGDGATTQVAPAGDTTQRNRDGSVRRGYGEETDQVDQRLSVSQLVPSPYCIRRAVKDDLLEISYLGTVLETGAVFDGSAIKINGEVVPGRGNDTTIFFVLGKQPFGQFPPAWDVGLEGICVGERRRLIVPPVLAFGSAGVPRRNIPPNASLQYDITLVSLNGLATP